MTTLTAVDQRRARLRELAETDPENLAELRALTPALGWMQRPDAWDALVQDVNLLIEIQAGAVEPQQIWHHIRRGDAIEIATEKLEQTIGEHLDALLGGAS